MMQTTRRSARFATFVTLIVAVVGCRNRALSPSDPDGGAGGAGAPGATDARDAGSAISLGAGCGKALPINQPVTVPGTPEGDLQYTVMGTGATLAGPQPQKVGARTFWVRVPADNDPNHAYRVVYIGQGCGGYDIANSARIRSMTRPRGATRRRSTSASTSRRTW
jgi:hypothetical protein